MRHTDQKLTQQQVKLFGIFFQSLAVGLRRFDLKHLHPALKPAHQRLFLIFAKVMAGSRMERAQDRGKFGGRVLVDAFFVFAVRDTFQMALMRDDPLGHRFDRQHIIDKPGVGGTFRHPRQRVAIIFGLCKREAAMFLYRREADRTVTARA